MNSFYSLTKVRRISFALDSLRFKGFGIFSFFFLASDSLITVSKLPTDFLAAIAESIGSFVSETCSSILGFDGYGRFALVCLGVMSGVVVSF